MMRVFWMIVVAFVVGVVAGWSVAHHSELRYAQEKHVNMAGYAFFTRRDRVTGDQWERYQCGPWRKVEAPAD